MSVRIVRTVAELRALVAGWKEEGERVAVVPTMGALHEGHLSLVREAMARAGRVIVTLFVNPKQFNSAADLAAYPRTEVSDAARLESLGGTMVLFAPDGDEMYPPGFATGVTVSGVSEGLCGAGRPGHFDGVATVVSKLLLIAGADVALFGEKDFQQLQVVRRMATDLNLPTEIVDDDIRSVEEARHFIDEPVRCTRRLALFAHPSRSFHEVSSARQPAVYRRHPGYGPHRPPRQER